MLGLSEIPSSASSRRVGNGRWLILGVFAALTACKERPEGQAAPVSGRGSPAPTAGGPGSGASPAPAEVDSIACPETPGSGSLTLGAPPPRLDEDDLAPLVVPDAIEVGGTAILEDGFAVAFLEGGAGETHAKLSFSDAALSSGRVVDLGRVHGLVPPPRVARASAGLLVAVADGGVSGIDTRLVRVEGDGSSSWGTRLPQGSDESPEFGVAVSGKRGLLVWDAWERREDVGSIWGALVSADTATVIGDSFRLSAEGVDAEGPRVVADGDGFWVAWAVVGPLDPAQRRHVGPDEAPGALVGPRWGELARVGTSGTLEGRPLEVTSRDARLLGFDLGASDGSAWFTWREGAASPESPGGRILFGRVGRDGSIDRDLVLGERVGPGEPVVLASGGHGWLAFGDTEDSPRLARISPGGRVGPARVLLGFGVGMPLALAGDDVLVATPRGRSVELSLRRCPTP
jgi:hypothetical protein